MIYFAIVLFIQAHVEFFTILEQIFQIIDLKQVTIEFEIIRCFLSTIILVIVDADYENSSDFISLLQRLKTLLQQQQSSFSLILNEQQYRLVLTRLSSIINIDTLINLLKTTPNEDNFSNLILFIQNELKTRSDFEKLIEFVLYTFDNQFLSIEQTLQISNLLCQHPNLNNKTLKNLLQYLIELLELKIHSSPKLFLNSIENNQENDDMIRQITIMLTVQNGKYAVAAWRKAMFEILKILANRTDDYKNLPDIAQQSPMFRKPQQQQALESCLTILSNNLSDTNKERKLNHSIIKYSIQNKSS